MGEWRFSYSASQPAFTLITKAFRIFGAVAIDDSVRFKDNGTATPYTRRVKAVGSMGKRRKPSECELRAKCQEYGAQGVHDILLTLTTREAHTHTIASRLTHTHCCVSQYCLMCYSPNSMSVVLDSVLPAPASLDLVKPSNYKHRSQHTTNTRSQCHACNGNTRMQCTSVHMVRAPLV